MMRRYVTQDKADLPIKTAKSIRREDLGETPQWFEKHMALNASKAEICARFCARWEIGSPTLLRLFMDVFPKEVNKCL